jgi:hypothetical protein
MSPPRSYRGRPVSWSSRYPTVYHPNHPAAMRNGMAYIHRLVAWELYGGIPEGCQVHHKDGDPSNWSATNLELLTPEEHGRRHRPPKPPQVRRCGACDAYLEIRTRRRRARQRVYCSHECAARGREVAAWPEDDDLLGMVHEEGASGVARRLAVSDTAIRKRVARIVRNRQAD